MRTPTSLRPIAMAFIVGAAILSIVSVTAQTPPPALNPAGPHPNAKPQSGTESSRPELSLKRSGPATFVVTVSGARENDVLSIAVTPSTIQANPASWKLPKADQKIARSFVLAPPSGKTLSGEIRVDAELTRPSKEGPGEVLVSANTPFEYREGISLAAYFVWGLIGILLGYWLRLLIKILAAVPAPSPSPTHAEQQPPPPGPLTRFVQRHYYAVDGGVTTGIGFLALVALIEDGQPPANATYWFTALAVGVGLGLLTNSELLTKLPR